MPMDILTLAYQIFKDFGCTAVLSGIIIFLVWKLGSNHLKHIGDDVKTCISKIDKVSEDVKTSKEDVDKKFQTVNEKVDSLGERTSKVEGKLGI
jgi:hypothetical protein